MRITETEKEEPKKPTPGTEDEVTTSNTTRQPGEAIGDGEDYIGTLGAPVRESAGDDWHFFTCEHIGDGFSEGDTLYTGGSSFSSEIGEVIDESCSDDMAVAEPEDGWEPSRAIAGEGGTEVSGAGQFTLDGLADLEENDEEVKKFGTSSGITSGEVETHDGTYWVNEFSCPRRTNQLRWGDEDVGEGGDSGSPVYKTSPNNDDWFWVAASFHAIREDHIGGGDFAHGTSAWTITEDHGWQFYSPELVNRLGVNPRSARPAQPVEQFLC
ncbi:uncharacterized protein Nmag_2091 [Natrialba magadii ATCC 43099]|uniref:Uncharacterized protein n=1 Tax=Natrialba magadii (strain ATCC 43099 / DSM 3394 / CCM 3739 / CIP 104546 / IAM 13178 / JCM 8861 / NBRC 102185 / NCIMB 2190 / MS3) TaxID=547559 RepID=D3SVZ9_NATMM|nr:hypothetical protein [Natrialba magadii]ADD05660.1 uncharacterized protein Nmag_2091 [Natrialba magadii ATCC 43099]